jgi:hypothetical protein
MRYIRLMADFFAPFPREVDVFISSFPGQYDTFPLSVLADHLEENCPDATSVVAKLRQLTISLNDLFDILIRFGMPEEKKFIGKFLHFETPHYLPHLKIVIRMPLLKAYLPPINFIMGRKLFWRAVTTFSFASALRRTVEYADLYQALISPRPRLPKWLRVRRKKVKNNNKLGQFRRIAIPLVRRIFPML